MELVHTLHGHYNTTTYTVCDFYIQLPSNVSSLNEFMCGLLNREGPLCGKCKDGYGLRYIHTLWNAVSAGDMVTHTVLLSN